jgi:preprotein translocase subunit SecA
LAEIELADSDDQLANQIINEAGERITLKNQILDYVADEVTGIVSLRAPEDFSEDEFAAIIQDFVKIIPFDELSQKRLAKKLAKLADVEEMTDELMNIVSQTYEKREEKIGEALMRELEKFVVLSTIDEKWMDHLDAIEDLRQGIWLRGDKNTVLAEYKREAFNMFEELIANIQSTIAQRIFRVQPVMKQAVAPVKNLNLQKEDVHSASLSQEMAKTSDVAKKGSSNDLAAALKGSSSGRVQANAVKANQASSKFDKVGRNDPCPCGSGLKYKKCGLLGKCVENGGNP